MVILPAVISRFNQFGFLVFSIFVENPFFSLEIVRMFISQITKPFQSMKSSLQNYLLLLIVFLLVSSSLTSCVTGMAAKRITVENGCIPAEFGKNPGTLLLLKEKGKSYNKYLKKVFDHYQGKHEYITLDQLSKPPYTDLEKYPYLLDFERELHSQGAGTTDYIDVRRFYIEDRSTGKRYESKITSSYYAKILKAYVSNLNALIGG